MRTVGVVTVARSDFGIYLPVLKLVMADKGLRLRLFVGGMHLSPEFGRSVSFIEAAGIPIAERVEMLVSSDTPEGIAKSMGLGMLGFGQVFGRERPDILLVLGDRFEMFCAASAAAPFKIPVAHIHGGEVTQGATDDAWRHSITKLSHLHFVATEEYARRVRQLGEEPWRITVAGAPGLDNLSSVERMSRTELQAKLGFALEATFLLATFHPVTLEYEKTAWQCAELLKAIELSGHQTIFTLPNADTEGRRLGGLIRDYVEANPRCRLVENLGTPLYFNLMRHGAAMVGNSSSGIIEAPSFKLPVVNVGQRQAGRVRGANVIDVGDDHVSILAGIAEAMSAEFRARASDSPNPYSTGKPASPVIVDTIKAASLNQALLQKRFCDLPLGCM